MIVGAKTLDSVLRKLLRLRCRGESMPPVCDGMLIDGWTVHKYGTDRAGTTHHVTCVLPRTYVVAPCALPYDSVCAVADIARTCTLPVSRMRSTVTWTRGGGRRDTYPLPAPRAGDPSPYIMLWTSAYALDRHPRGHDGPTLNMERCDGTLWVRLPTYRAEEWPWNWATTATIHCDTLADLTAVVREINNQGGTP